MNSVNKFVRTGIIVAMTAAGAMPVYAQTYPIKVTSTGGPFLRIVPDTRAAGMGNLGLATDADAGSIYFNLAKAPFAGSKTAIAVNYTPRMKAITSDIYLLSASGYHQLDELQAIGGSVRYFNMGDLSVRDYNGTSISTFRPSELAVDAGYSRKLSDRLALGVAMRYTSSKFAAGTIDGAAYKAANALAGDVSLYYNAADSLKGGWSAGLAVTNLGSKIGYTDDASRKEFLPASFGAGIAYSFVANSENRILLGIDYNKLLVPALPADEAGMDDYYKMGVFSGISNSFNNKAWSLAAGVEYNYRSLLNLRAGYIIVPKNAGGNGGFTAGIGVNVVHRYAINFAYLASSNNGGTQNAEGNTLRVGLGFTLK